MLPRHSCVRAGVAAKRPSRTPTRCRTPQPAISLGEELNRTLKERYGEKHFLTLVGQTYLALAYARDRKLPQALALIEPCHAAVLEQFGPDSPIAIDAS